ncbi:MAG TPA: ABC transporter ATP-binding protein [Actinomycetota bacterium]
MTTAEADPAVRIRGLRKSYGHLEAVRGIALEVRRGEIFALLGPNGAGKTTTLEILEGYRRRSAGDVSVLGHDPERRDRTLRQRIGIVLQSTGVDPYLTARETVELYAGYYPRPRDVDEVLAIVGLTERGNDRVVRLSGGQRRRLDVAVALAGDPELLFLDEPTSGFDPAARRQAWDVIRNLSSLGKTVLLTSHYMDEAHALADRVAVISRGEIVAEGPPATLGDRHLADSVIRFRMPAGVRELPAALGDPAPVGDGTVELLVADPTRALHALTGWAIERGVSLEGLEVTRPTLEDVYLDLTHGEAGST